MYSIKNKALVRNMKRQKPHFRRFKQELELHMLAFPAMLVILVFCYFPMYGVIIAFQDYIPARGVLSSNWVGFKHFINLFSDPFFYRIFKNTVLIGVYSLLFSFPAPIILALFLNELNNGKFKKTIQTISYMPYFISTVIVVGLLKELFGLSSGIINDLMEIIGLEKINFFEKPEWFRPLYIGSNIWTGIGYGSIIYLAAMANISPSLYEAAVIDGAGRFRQAISITLPSIAPTIQILFIFAVGGIMGNNFEKILLMYSPITYETADVISTYVYRKGILGGQFSYSSAVVQFKSVISLSLIFLTNYISKKIGSESLY